MDQQDRKAALRRSVRDARRTLDPEVRHTAAAAINRRLLHLPELLTARVVLLYAASSAEVDVEATASALRARGVRTLYPRVRGVDLDLVAVSSPLELVGGHRGILEPQGAAADPSIVDAVVVPGVAYDLRGHRLGQGGGHFDRLLPRIGEAWRIAVAFTIQIVPAVPHTTHDVPMDLLVTERGVHRFDREAPA